MSFIHNSLTQVNTFIAFANRFFRKVYKISADFLWSSWRQVKMAVSVVRWAVTEAWEEVSTTTPNRHGFVRNTKKTYWRFNYTAWKEHFLKKYVYTINHKRIGLSYLYFCLFSGLAGAMLATFIRLELSYPGSHFFKGDSVRYIQVITAHGLIMIFYVVVPVVFGLFANYFIPYHILSKDVAFPRLNSIGFWLLPAGFLLMSRPAFSRRQLYKNWDPYSAYNSTKADILKNFTEVLGDDVYKLVNKKEDLTYGKLHQIFQLQPTSKVFLTQDELVLRRLWDGHGSLVNRGFLKNLLPTDPKGITDLKTEYYMRDWFRNIYGDIGSLEKFLNFKILKLEFLFDNDWKHKAILGNYFVDEKADHPRLSLLFYKKYYQEENNFILTNYFKIPMRHGFNTPPVRTVEDIRWTLRDQLNGRVATKSKNKLDIVENWTDFLLLWEYNYQWYENPWQTLRHAMKTKTIVMKNERCSSPTAVMSGWTFITPFSSQTRFTGLGAQDAATLSVLFAGLSSTLSFTNLLITRRVLAAPGFKNRKNTIPFLSISLFLVMRMLALITPVLGAAMVMLLMDRHWSTSFFDYAYGGDSILFHHLFWFFGHPEVYVVIIPAFGIVNSFLPYYNKRRIASKNHLVWATYVMAYMGFLVWGHHMYLVGLDHRSRSLYSTITVMISLPAVVKIVNWTLTFLNGVIRVDVSLYFIVSFLTFFLSGGLTGLWLSHVGLNLFVHDTFYVVAHFHFMFSCATFSALFAGFYFYYKEFFGVNYSKPIATLHYIFWTIGQWLTFTPLYWVGYNGLPRRYHDYPVMYMGWHGLSSSGHMLTMISIVFFLIGILESKFRKKSPTYYYGVPRTFKRAQYETLKTIELQKIEMFTYRTRTKTFEWEY